MLRQPSLVSETRLKTMICPHIALIRRINLIEMDDKKQCDECNQKASDLWLCMQKCCSFVGCGEKVGNHVKSHHEKTNHAVYLSKENKRIWCFGCGVSLDKVQLDVSEDAVQYKSMEEELDNDDNESEEMEEEAAMIDKNYFDGFEKGMKPRGLTGLKNIGNTCYMNSALQALSNSPSLMQFFLDCSSYVKSNHQANLSEVYAALVSDMWSKKRPTCVTPSDFMGCFQRLNPQFRGYRQQDTQEFLRVLMDLLHEEMKEPMPPEDIKPEIPLRKLTKRISSRSKRLLGGQTMVEKHNTDRVQNGGRKTRGFPYLRNRRKDASKSISTTTTTNQNVEKTRPLSTERFLRNTSSCPELRKTMSRDDINSASFEPRISLGVVNMASDDFNISGNRKGAGLSLERSISDSEIYCHRPAGFRGESKDTSDQKRPPVEYASVISDLFNGKIRSSVQCLTCKKISSTMETFQDLSLSIPGKEEISVIHSSAQCNPISRDSPTVSSEKGFFRSLFDWFASWIYGPRVSFEDCLAAFFSADELKGDNMYRCEHCSMLRNGMKQCRVYKLPEMLCIHLKRFRHEYFSSSKISSFISFPLEALDVKKYLTSDFAGECSKFDLVAVISHYGSVGGGHYVACCKNFITGKWYEFNDSKVSEVSESYVQNCEAYVLFYRKRGENIIKYRQKFVRLTKSNEGKPTTHYVSKKWLTMFYTSAEPGPIANGSFLCKHGKIEPNKKLHLKDLLTPLQSACWLYLLKKFGGGPEITNLDVCAVCENELKELEQRRRYEFKTWKEKMDDSKSSSPQCFISMKWFKEWKSFVDGNSKDPPGPIYNHKTGQQRKQVPKSVWNFLFSIYGGSHMLPFQEN